ncbi:MAG: DUF488 domain-containing protein [Microbacteriaceae bacterium]|nr:DUF488 domain-containing protein [Microbacteriaceae bacterium]
MTSEILSIGYEGMTLESFIARLRLRDISTLIDVRLNPISRKKGFSKSGLTAALADAGISYVHLPALGNPKDNREGFASTESPEAIDARSRYASLLDEETALAAIDRVIEESDQAEVALLCFEADPRHCHRTEVLHAVEQRRLALTTATR